MSEEIDDLIETLIDWEMTAATDRRQLALIRAVIRVLNLCRTSSMEKALMEDLGIGGKVLKSGVIGVIGEALKGLR